MYYAGTFVFILHIELKMDSHRLQIDFFFIRTNNLHMQADMSSILMFHLILISFLFQQQKRRRRIIEYLDVRCYLEQ